MTNYQPHPGQPTAPPRKRSKLAGCLIVGAVLVALVIALIVVVAVVSGGGDSDDNGSTGGSTKTSAPADRGAPRAVTVGKEFTIGKHRLDNGWKLAFQPYLGTKLTGSVTNVSKDNSTAVFHVKLLKGAKVVANLQCTTNDLEPGQSEDVECLNTVQGAANLTAAGSYDKVTAEATF